MFVAILWGATNPFLTKGSAGVEKLRGSGIQKKISEVVFLATKWKASLLFECNFKYFFHTMLLLLTVRYPVYFKSIGQCAVFHDPTNI